MECLDEEQMTKEQLELIKELIAASVKEHAMDYSVHRQSRYVLKKVYAGKIQKISQKLLATCEDGA